MTDNPKTITDIYRSTKKEGLYLYLNRGENFEALPDALRKAFGPPEKAMTIVLTADRKLAIAKAEDVIQQLNDPGYYLQMPPKDNLGMEALLKACSTTVVEDTQSHE